QIYHIQNNLFKYFGILCTVSVIGILILLLCTILYQGFDRLSWDFLTGLPSRFPEKSGIYTALAGMVGVLMITIVIAFPVGIAAAIYLEEYGVNNRMAKFIEVNIANLAGVPSVI